MSFSFLCRKDDPIKQEFYSLLRKAYEGGAEYLEGKFPINNELLKLLSAIDPKCHGKTVAAQMTRRLASYFPTAIKSEEADDFEREVDKFHLEINIPEVSNNGTSKQLDEWWGEVFLLYPQYQILYKLIKACLSIFTGPMIEQSFR